MKNAFAKPRQRAAIALLESKEKLVERFKTAPRGTPLGGVPFFAKDLFDFAGTPTLAGTTFLNDVRPTPKHDGGFARTLRAAGAVFVGKTQMHEAAYGITGENPHFGDCEHPQFPGRTTGGSSSGSAAVVAANIVPFALASDTGGSIRVPAAFCGLYGFRLTPGDQLIRDAFPLAPTFDTAGWFTNTAGDMRAMLGTLVDLRISAHVPRGLFLELGQLERDVATACRTAAGRIAPVADPAWRDELLRGFEPALEAYHTIVAVEAWQVHRSWAEKYKDRYDPAVWQRLNRVHTLTRTQTEDAQITLRKVRALWAKFFERFDFLVLPASPMAAPLRAECTAETRTRVLTLTAPASLGGCPTLTVPVPLTSGLTTGLQIIARDPGSPVFAWALEKFPK